MDTIELTETKAIRAGKAHPDYHPPRTNWRGMHRGKRWKDMPGGCEEDKKMNFALFRRGLLIEDINERKMAGLFGKLRKPKGAGA